MKDHRNPPTRHLGEQFLGIAIKQRAISILQRAKDNRASLVVKDSDALGAPRPR
jgi:hypothetical protein